jgi:hypothetical protein
MIFVMDHFGKRGLYIYEMDQINLSFALPSDADSKMAKVNCCGGTLSVDSHQIFHP